MRSGYLPAEQAADKRRKPHTGFRSRIRGIPGADPAADRDIRQEPAPGLPAGEPAAEEPVPVRQAVQPGQPAVEQAQRRQEPRWYPRWYP